MERQEQTAAAHPRSRGENITAVWDGIVTVGSSPLTRGKLNAVNDSAITTRLIPAHAGKTIYDMGWGYRERAHPRSRGENAPKSVPSS